MFGVKHGECVGFESRWKVKKVLSAGSTQTTNTTSAEAGTLTAKNVDMEVQTEAQLISQSDVDMDKLAAWLNNIYPSVKRELDDCTFSRAFRGYRLVSDSGDVTSKLKQDIEIYANIQKGDALSENRIGDLTWNCSGNTLAVACSYAHQLWCYHSPSVLLYTLDRNDKFPEKPNKKLSPETCIMVLDFHPASPAILAGGSYTGDIYVWNIQLEGGNETLIHHNGHTESITQLNWVNHLTPKSDCVATSSLDGLLILWNVQLVNSSINAHKKFKIKSPLFLKPQYKDKDKSKTFAINCFDFSKRIPDLFIVGLEGGLIVQCSLSEPTRLKATGNDPIYDPTFKHYDSQGSTIKAIKFSPYNREMFLTVTSATEVKIYLLNEEEPAKVIFFKHPMNSIRWVPFESRLLGGCGPTGEIDVFDIVDEKLITGDKKTIANAITCQMSINSFKTNMVAVASNGGTLQLWQVPWQSYSMKLLSK